MEFLTHLRRTLLFSPFFSRQIFALYSDYGYNARMLDRGKEFLS